MTLIEIKKILSYGTMAPSGENIQPWKFRIKENEHKVEIFNNPEKDNSLYNFRQNASHVAHGALLENIEIAANSLGYRTEIKLFPHPGDATLVSSVIFIQERVVNDSLLSAVGRRATNRKPYGNFSLPTSVTQDIEKSAAEVGTGKTLLKNSEADIKKLCKVLSVNERLIFENYYLHNFLFSHLRWTEQEELQNKNGLYLKTLELKPPQVASFKIFKKWGLLSLLNKVGVSKFIAKENEKIYATSSAIGIVAMPGNTPTDFVMGGKVFQRTWLKVTANGLSLQPLTGIIFLMQKIINNNFEGLSQEHIRLIENSYKEIKNIFALGPETIVMAFRIGKGGEPSAISSRLPIEELLI